MGKKEQRIARKAEREREAAVEEEKLRKIFLELAKETSRLLYQMYVNEVEEGINYEVAQMRKDLDGEG
jgi:hypothetical protein